MKTFVKKTIKIGLLLSVFFTFISLTINPLDKEKYISISQFIAENKLKVQINGLGGYQQECIEFSLKNTSSDTLNLLIEPGRIIISEDSSMQDILLVKEIKMFLSPFESRKIKGYGFCCRASRHSPAQGSIFNIGHMAPPDWIKVVDVIRKNNFPISAVQNAIWVLSDNHDVASIQSQNLQEVDILKRTVATIKGVEFPWYSIIYEKDTAMLFSNKHEKVVGNINYVVRQNTVVTINIRDQNGTNVKTLMQGAPRGAGEYTYELDLLVKNWPKGDYELFIYEDYSNLNQRRKFKL